MCFALKDSTFARVNMTNDSGILIIMFYSRYMPSTHTYTHTNTHRNANLMYAEIRSQCLYARHHGCKREWGITVAGEIST